jgi:hypothetical protein
MYRLVAVLYVLLSVTLAGIGVTVVLSLGHLTRTEIALSALAGAIVAIPLAWIVGKRLYALTRNA